MRILVIEDHEDLAEMLRRIFTLIGHQVAVATHGRQGVTMAQETRPDVIFCDLGLPNNMSGFDVARELRADPTMHRLCMVALSGHDRPEDKARCWEVGFDLHVTKPAEIKVLKQILQEIEMGTASTKL